MALEKPEMTTFQGIRGAFGTYRFSDAELAELVDPQFGIITGFSDLMAELEMLRRTDLGATPPAGGIVVPKDGS